MNSSVPRSKYAVYAAGRVVEKAEQHAAIHDWPLALALSENALAIDAQNDRARRLRKLARANVDMTGFDHPPGFLELPLRRELSAEQLQRVHSGYIAPGMDGKWIIEPREPYLFFHRSWTGWLQYRMQLEYVADGARLDDALIFSNGLRERSIAADSSSLEYVVLRFLLDEIRH